MTVGGIGPLEADVREAASRCSSFEFHGFVPDSELPEFYANLDLFLLPTESEGVPNVLLESMACGTPVLATRAGGIPDLISDGRNGYLLDDRSPKTICRAIEGIARSDTHGDVSRSARETMDNQYTYEHARLRYYEMVSHLVL
jgi:glycosyltransferase involved in cell wall biosynthesis